MKSGKHLLGFRLGKKSLFLACLIKNGFRDRITRIKSFGLVPSIGLFVLGLLAFAMVFWHEVGMIIAPALAIKFKKDDLTGDDKSKERQFLEDLEKRIQLENIPESASATEITAAYTKAISEALKPFDNVKLNIDKIAELMDDKTGVKSILVKQGQELAELKLKVAAGGGDKPESIRKQVEMWVEANKDAIEGLKQGPNRKQCNLPPIQIKAAITMTEAASLNASAYLPNVQVLPGVIEPIRVSATFWQRLMKGATKANPLIWVNKHNVQGAATFTAEGAAKPAVSFELETESSVPRKAAAKTKVSTEMLYDVDYLTSLITGELSYQVDKTSNTGVLTGSGVAPNPKGVTLYASLYTLGTIVGVTAPNNSDAIRAAIAQLRSSNVDGQLTAYVNPIDAAVMDLSKSLQGQYVLPPFTTADGRNIAATPVIEDNNIAVGYLLIGDMSKYHVLIHQDFYVLWGWENDDFTKNLVTVIAERRFHQWVSDNETIAFIYDTFANIKTAIS